MTPGRVPLPEAAQKALREIVAGWPPFSAEQRATLARLLTAPNDALPHKNAA